ncbi:hypothetical protein GBA52_016136 [Prunus armeniaca]|nr:hypothetical protein GBA52_016136 [Prunus armeniaca]
MVGGYAQRGFCEEAARLFQQMVQGGEAEPNEATIVNISSACSSIGALSLGQWIHPYQQLFSLMLVHGVPPDDVTFLGLLSACSHTGPVDQGLIFLNAMKDVYGIVPKTQHYACVVDMYGRAGFLEEAEGFIKEMPTKADGSVWGALLNACWIHGNDKMFERIRDGLLKSRGLSTGTYALLSNMYANHDRWDDANKVRDEMRRM